LPETFYYQVDGESKVRYSCILGGVIWKKIRDSTSLTPQQYEEAIKDAFKDVGIPIIEDVFVVPGYQAYINPHLLDISQAFKLKYTNCSGFLIT